MVPLLFSIRLLPGATIANDFSHPFSLSFAIGAASVLDVTMALGNTIAFPLLSSLHGFHSQVLATSFDTLRTFIGVSNVQVEKFPYLENL